MLLKFLRHGRGATGEVTAVGDTGVLQVCNLFVNLFALRTNEGVLLFDTGMDLRGRPIDALLDVLGCSREAVTDVFLTHAHPDHVAGAPTLPSARVHGGADDEDRFLGIESGKKRPERIFRALFKTPMVRVTHLLQAEAQFECGDVTVEAFPTPGDTPGAFAFLANGCLFVGDAMDLREGRLQPAMEFATDNPRANLRSIVALYEWVADYRLEFLCTAHGGTTLPGTARTLLGDIAHRAARALKKPG